MTPTLYSKRTKLVPYVAGFVTPQHVEWLNDEETMRYSEQRHKFHTLESQHKYLNGFLSNQHIWLIKHRDGDDIGTISAHIDANNGVADMGILIGDRAKWGYGYGSEAWKCVMNWLWTLESPRIRKIECGTMHDNRAMRRLATKCGMTCEGVKPGHFLLDGNPVGLAFYGKMRSSRIKTKAEAEYASDAT